jgi:hypothetical protein
MQAFWEVAGSGLLLIVLGLITLLYTIPRLTERRRIHTEFLSSRAALWCVGAGLGLVFLAAIETSAKDALSAWNSKSTVVQEKIDVSRKQCNQREP